MCELLGMNANTPTDVMFSFAGLARRVGSANAAKVLDKESIGSFNACVK